MHGGLCKFDVAPLLGGNPSQGVCRRALSRHRVARGRRRAAWLHPPGPLDAILPGECAGDRELTFGPNRPKQSGERPQAL